MTAEPFTFFTEEYYLRFGWWLLCVPAIAWMLFASPWVIFRRLEGRKERAIARAKKIGRWLLIMIVLYVAQGAYDRATPYSCHVSKPTPDGLWGGPSPDGLYEMEICLIAGTASDASVDGLARLRSAKDGTVLAEAEFHNPSFTRVSWDTDEVIVGIGSGSASINLPPSLLDRLRAKLP